MLYSAAFLAKPRAPIDEASLGLAHERVQFDASDGVGLSGWYVPSRNGAAIVLVHGGGGDRQGTIRHARMLAHAGYGVLRAALRRARPRQQLGPRERGGLRTRPLLLIGTEPIEREWDRAYVRGTNATLWELPATAHTKGLADHPRAYTARVLALFGGALH